MKRALFIAALMATTVIPVTAMADNATEQELIALTQRLFDGLAARDADLFREILVDDGYFYSTRLGDDGWTSDATSFEGYITTLTAGNGTGPALLERAWDHEVLVSDTIAHLWAPYDFWIDGKFSHCGIDAVSFIKEGGDWRISSINYTVKATDCAEHPDGPPPGD